MEKFDRKYVVVKGYAEILEDKDKPKTLEEVKGLIQSKLGNAKVDQGSNYCKKDERELSGEINAYNDCLTLIEQVADKETPKKPIGAKASPMAIGMGCDRGSIAYVCPRCGKKEVAQYAGSDINNYCPDCGQRIDWGKGERQ